MMTSFMAMGEKFMGRDAGAPQQQAPEDLLGRTLGTCTLERILGRGGMGVVYLAQQSRPHRQVAVKVLLLSLMPDPDRRARFLRRFRREADAVAVLDHPNILPIFEYGEQADVAYLVMPYVGGGTLRDRVERKGALPLAEVAHFLNQAAAALDYAHAHGVIHRDVKPQNMLLYPDKRLMLSDFGIAKVAQAAADGDGPASPQLTTLGHVVGTPDYIAPEQAMGHEVDPRVDIYSLGVVLFYLVTGRVPFVASQPMAVAARHVSEPPPLPRSLRPDLPPAAEAVILKAMAKDPAARYRSAGELARAFRAALPAQSGQAPSAQPRRTAQPPAVPPVISPNIRISKQAQHPAGPVLPGKAPVGPARPPRRRWLSLVLALLAILLASVGAYAAVKGIEQQKPTPPPASSQPAKQPSPTNTTASTPSNTPKPAPTNTPASILYQAEQFLPQPGDLPANTTLLDPQTATTPDQFHALNPGRVVDPTVGYAWQKDIVVQIDRNGSKYLLIALDQFSTAADARHYFQTVMAHLKQTQHHAIGQDEVDGWCCDNDPSAYNVFFRDQNVTVLMLVETSDSAQAIQDALTVGTKMDQHAHSSAALTPAGFLMAGRLRSLAHL